MAKGGVEDVEEKKKTEKGFQVRWRIWEREKRISSVGWESRRGKEREVIGAEAGARKGNNAAATGFQGIPRDRRLGKVIVRT